MCYGNYSFCRNCNQIIAKEKSFCSEKCSDQYTEKGQRVYEKRERRQKWLESLHAKVKKVLERKSIHRLERKRARALIEKIEDQFTTISWEIYEKRKLKKNVFNFKRLNF